MTQTSYPFDSQTVTETQFSQFFRELQETGVAGSHGGTDLVVSAPGSGMTVNVAAGTAVVRGHFYKNDAVQPVTIVASESQARTDVIVLRLDPTANSIVLAAVKGTAGGGVPSLSQTDTGTYEFPLAYVAVGASVSSIAAAGTVTDKRTFIGRGTGAWATSERPASPRKGKLGLNVTTGSWEYWNGSAWTNLTPNLDWSAITGKPSTFAPSAHTHDWADITGKPTLFTPAAHYQDWGTITGKPATYPPDGHSHAYAASSHTHAYASTGHGHGEYCEAANTTYGKPAGRVAPYANATGAVHDHAVSGGGSYYAVWVDGSGNFGRNTSSRRYKENIRDHAIDPNAILKLRPVMYDRINGNPDEFGLIAEEVAQHMPEVIVTHGEDRVIESVRYDLLFVAALSHLKQQDERIAALEAAVAALMEK